MDKTVRSRQDRWVAGKDRLGSLLEPLSAMINIIIFSKDRACQLDLLLSSMKRHFKEWRDQNVSVLYTASALEFETGYRKVVELHPEPLYVREADFKTDLVRMFLERRRDYTSFLVDDDMFIDHLTLDSPEFGALRRSPKILCLSCRMAPGMDFFYMKQIEVPQPRFRADRTWRWKRVRGDWGYPMSAGGMHIFRSSDLERAVVESEYHNPNTFEDWALLPNAPRRPFMICFERAKVFCVAVNRVQTVNQNRHANTYPVEVLNSEFLAGRRLSSQAFQGLKTRSPHGELTYVWE